MERADDMVEVVVGADILVFAIDLFTSGIKDLEGNACDAAPPPRSRASHAQGGVGFQVGGDRNVKAREGHIHSSGFELCGGRGVLVGSKPIAISKTRWIPQKLKALRKDLVRAVLKVTPKVLLKVVPKVLLKVVLKVVRKLLLRLPKTSCQLVHLLKVS